MVKVLIREIFFQVKKISLINTIIFNCNHSLSLLVTEPSMSHLILPNNYELLDQSALSLGFVAICHYDQLGYINNSDRSNRISNWDQLYS